MLICIIFIVYITSSEFLQILTPLLQHAENMAKDVTRMLPCYTTHTSTGRIYIRDPNLQNIPKEFVIHTQNICPRMTFEAAPGHTLISADFSQVELRLLAHFSKDPALSKVLSSARDVFREMAAELHDIPYDRVTDVQRQHAKKVCYGILYGMSAETLQVEIGCQSLLEARNFILAFNNKFQMANIFLKQTAEMCFKEGFVKTLKGRNRYFKVGKSMSNHLERQAKNTILQGSAADLTKMAMVHVQVLLELHSMAKYTKLVLHLHDELIFEVPNFHVKKVAKIVRMGMETAVKLNVPLPVKLRSGPSWGQLREYAE
jgi:DNA polymerase theta